MSYGAKGWLLVIAVILLIDWKAPPGQTLSEHLDRLMLHPLGKILVPLAVYHVADHLANRLDERVDLLHLFFALIRADAQTSDNC